MCDFNANDVDATLLSLRASAERDGDTSFDAKVNRAQNDAIKYENIHKVLEALTAGIPANLPGTEKNVRSLARGLSVQMLSMARQRRADASTATHHHPGMADILRNLAEDIESAARQLADLAVVD